MVGRASLQGNTKSFEHRYFISIGVDCQAVRECRIGHWSVENPLRLRLDGIFGDDAN